MDSAQEIGCLQNCWLGGEALLGSALGSAEQSHQEVGIVLTDEARHSELLLKMAASGTSCFVCGLEKRHRLYSGAFICTATEPVAGHWHAAADSHTCQERQPENIFHIYFANLVCPFAIGILGLVVS